MTAEKIVKLFETAKDERITYNSIWDDCNFYCTPSRLRIQGGRMPGSEVASTLYSSIGRTSASVFAAGLHSYMTSPSQKWFSLRFKDEEHRRVGAGWLKKCEDVEYGVLNASNFNQQIFAAYREAAVLGNTCLYEEEIPDGVRFFNRAMGEIYFIENANGDVEEVFRFFEFSAKQAVDFFGEENVSDKARKKLKDKPYEKISFIHYVYPRERRDSSKDDALNKPFASLWVEYEEKKICKEGGYNEFPFFIARLSKNSEETYGYGLATIVLPELKMANRMRKTLIVKAEKAVSPPLDAPNEGYTLPLDQTPDAVNYHDRGMSKEDLIRPLLPDTTNALPINQELIKETEDIIKKAFFVDLFLMLTTLPKMTATEVNQRVNEKMMILAPFLGRIMHSLLRPIIIRTFNICLRNGKFPPPPPGLEGADYEIDYVSPLARAQKMAEAGALQNFLMLVREIAQVSPEALDKINIDKIIEDYAKIQHVPPEIIRDDSEVNKIRKKRQEQMLAQEAMSGQK